MRHKTRNFSLLVCLGVVYADIPIQAQLQSISYVANLDPAIYPLPPGTAAPTDRHQTVYASNLFLSQFNPSFGALKAIVFDAVGAANGRFLGVTSPARIAGMNANWHDTSIFAVKGVGNVVNTLFFNASDTLDASRGLSVIDYPTQSYRLGPAVISEASFSDYIGYQNVAILVTQIFDTEATISNGSMNYQFTVSTAAATRITYFYAPVPETGTFLAVFVFLSGTFLQIRRQRRMCRSISQ